MHGCTLKTLVFTHMSNQFFSLCISKINEKQSNLNGFISLNVSNKAMKSDVLEEHRQRFNEIGEVNYGVEIIVFNDTCEHVTHTA